MIFKCPIASALWLVSQGVCTRIAHCIQNLDILIKIVLKLVQPSRVINQRIEVIEKELSQSKKNDVVLMKSDSLRQFEKCHEKKRIILLSDEDAASLQELSLGRRKIKTFQ